MSHDGAVLDRVGAGTAGRRDGDFAEAEFHIPQGGLAMIDGRLWVADTTLDPRRIRSAAVTPPAAATVTSRGTVRAVQPVARASLGLRGTAAVAQRRHGPRPKATVEPCGSSRVAGDAVSRSADSASSNGSMDLRAPRSAIGSAGRTGSVLDGSIDADGSPRFGPAIDAAAYAADAVRIAGVASALRTPNSEQDSSARR